MSERGTERCIGCDSEIEGDGFYGQGDVKPKGLDGLSDGESVPVSELFGFNDGPYCTLKCSLDTDTDCGDDKEIRTDGGTDSSETEPTYLVTCDDCGLYESYTLERIARGRKLSHWNDRQHVAAVTEGEADV